MTIEISLEDGKYTYRRDEETGEQTALRYGEEWRDLVGDNFVAAMADRILDLQHKLSEKSPAAKTVDWGMMEEPTQQELDRIQGTNPGDVLLDEVGAKLQSKLDAVTTWSAADWAEVLSYADEETLAKLPNFLACPFPCGWQTLHKIAVQDAAFLAKFNWPEDEEGVSVPKAVAMRSMDNLIQICRAMLSQSASQKEAPLSAEPVAWLLTGAHGHVRCAWTEAPSAEMLEMAKIDGDTVTPLYASVVAAQEQPQPFRNAGELPEGDGINPIENVLADLLKLAEEYEVKVESEWGTARSLKQIEEDGDLPIAIANARAALAQQDASKSKRTITAGSGRVKSFGKITMGDALAAISQPTVSDPASGDREEFDSWWSRFTAEHDEWRYADSHALRWAAWQARAALTQQDADKEDAERYRWLRNEAVRQAFGDDTKAPAVFNVDDCYQHDDSDLLEGEELDASIDAARQEKKQ